MSRVASKAPLLPAAALFRRSRLPPRTTRGVALSGSGTPGASLAAGPLTPSPTPTPVPGASPPTGSCRSDRQRSPPSAGAASAASAGRRPRASPAAGCWGARRHVQFATPSKNESYDITPYEDFYGMHPDCFNFDSQGNMVPYSAFDVFSPPGMLSPSPTASSYSGVSTATPSRSTDSLQVPPMPHDARPAASLAWGLPSPRPAGALAPPAGPSPHGASPAGLAGSLAAAAAAATPVREGDGLDQKPRLAPLLPLRARGEWLSDHRAGEPPALPFERRQQVPIIKVSGVVVDLEGSGRLGQPPCHHSVL